MAADPWKLALDAENRAGLARLAERHAEAAEAFEEAAKLYDAIGTKRARQRAWHNRILRDAVLRKGT